ncbi:4-oxalomesaconate tautomerase [Sphingopyxis sp. OAS728]|uniref:4-oxalomesaconate tautomerase n=1 Tax=Sphingopyxis sp. OAS728 TaxID=2663823 RepID=UPI00178960DF|nr:4-oxalomesaconate tautomerase [Sphingopyxis sp. OAS728]MBE1527984.1 4-oxalomesaconate tautomerase [Sphingopyxis sp. OAS728]
MSDGVRAMWMRGGTSKGLYMLRGDLPAERAARDAFLLRALGSPDARQIDGLGGGDPLTSKIALVSRSDRPGIDIDYLFLQAVVDRPVIADTQNCGNILAGVAPFAIERGLVAATDGQTRVAIHMENSGQVAVATVDTPGGKVRYGGAAAISGVPGTAAPIPLLFRDTAGSTCGALLPTGRGADRIDGLACTLIDNGMPCVVLAAGDLGVSGYEEPATLEENGALKARLEAIRLQAGPMMNLGDVRGQTVPKMMLVAPPASGGSVSVRSFIPHRVHAAVGVLGAVSVAAACLVEDSPAKTVAVVGEGHHRIIGVEHPTGLTECVVVVGDDGKPVEAGMLRTARKLMDGVIFA